MAKFPARLKKGFLPVRAWANDQLRPWLRDLDVRVRKKEKNKLKLSALEPFVFFDESGTWKIAVAPGHIYADDGTSRFKLFVPDIDSTAVTETIETANLSLSASDTHFYLKATFENDTPDMTLSSADFELHSSEQTDTDTEKFILWAEVETDSGTYTIKPGTAAEGPIVIQNPGTVSGSGSGGGGGSSGSSGSSGTSKDSIFRFTGDEGDEFIAYEVAEGDLPYLSMHWTMEVDDGTGVFPIDPRFTKCVVAGTMQAQVTVIGPPVAVSGGVEDNAFVRARTATTQKTVVQVALTGVKAGDWVPFVGERGRILDTAEFLAAKQFWNTPQRAANNLRIL